MKVALVSPNESTHGGWRIAQVEEIENKFEVAAPLEWIGCDDNVVADHYYYDPVTNTIKAVPKAIAANTSNTSS